MKQHLSFLFTCAAAILFSSCQKNLANLKNEEVNNAPLPGQTTYCRVESLWEKGSSMFPGDLFSLVLYDEYENPVAITSQVITTSRPYHIFRYDSWHRLTEYIGHYGNGTFQFWHKYGYDNQGRISVDTLYISGAFGPTVTTYGQRRISVIAYDSQNRMSGILTYTTISPVIMYEFFDYDSRGNRIYNILPAVVYDDKVNINRTNDIWQFLSKEYSMNNPFIADEYNSAGLPTKTNFPMNIIGNHWLRAEFNLSNAEISYSCRPAYW